jgi:hypothetical protein
MGTTIQEPSYQSIALLAEDGDDSIYTQRFVVAAIHSSMNEGRMSKLAKRTIMLGQTSCLKLRNCGPLLKPSVCIYLFPPAETDSTITL